jgi:hypothetical protein
VNLNGQTVIENAQLPGVPKRGRIALQHHGIRSSSRTFSSRRSIEKSALRGGYRRKQRFFRSAEFIPLQRCSFPTRWFVRDNSNGLRECGALVPEGHCENSPAFQRWVVWSRSIESRRDDTKLRFGVGFLPSLRDSSLFSPQPSVETLGYCRMSLWDRHRLNSLKPFAATLSVRETKRTKVRALRRAGEIWMSRISVCIACSLRPTAAMGNTFRLSQCRSES